MPYICQNFLPICPWMDEITLRLPGTQRIDKEHCFLIDDAFNLQMKYRDWLISKKLDQVFFNWFDTQEEVKELLDFTIFQLKKTGKYFFNKRTATRPDSVEIDLKYKDPLIAASRLIQEDILLLQYNGSEHILKAGVLCFPASWTLNEKKGKSLTKIHNPVFEYTDTLAHRIERMFTNLKPDIPIWRSNFLLYDDYELFQPRLENEERGDAHKKLSQFMRVERQTIVKLPKTKVVAFAIHTFVVPYAKLSKMQKDTLRQHLT